jgi:hypothetical protein
LKETTERLLEDLYAVFGWKTRILTPFFGLFAWFSLKREEERLAGGWTYEPASFCEKNAAALALDRNPIARLKRETALPPTMADEPAVSFGK